MKRSAVLVLLSFVLAAGLLRWPKLYAESANDAMMSRLQQLSQIYPVQLTDQEKADTIQRCPSVQVNIQAIADRLLTIETSRNLLYDDILSQLQTTEHRLLTQQIDTSELDLLLANYAASRTNYKAALDDYHTALTDAATMDCTNNPELFRSAVEGFRASRKKVVDQVNTLRELINSDVKTSFDTIRDRIMSAEKK